ncbi:MAG TPA: periplasmic heavy metal sensor [Chthoniobacteraceae bacterium]|nr:periplasmic heavy metal sensor [Chthoniobacteraceae bacterium]
MKGLLVIALTLAAALGGYFSYYRCATARTQAMLTRADGGMEWLRDEYHLSDAQFARVRQVHADYAPKCDLNCGRIAKANARLGALIEANKTFTPELDAAMNECATVQAECRRALLRHIYEVSAEMSPADGARYVQMMAARIVEPGLAHTAVISQSAK